MKIQTKKFVLNIVVCFFALTTPVVAFELPALDKPVSITVREQPVQQFLESLFAQINVPVVVSEEIHGLMNGKFEGNARDVLNDLSNAFNVTMYFDGMVAHVYGANEITRTLMPISSSTATQVEKIAARLKIGDRNNRLDSGVAGGFMVTGTRRFMEQIEELSFLVQSNAESPQKSPSVYRIFYLSYGWASDTSVKVAGQSVTVPGVASLLNKLVDNGGLSASVSIHSSRRASNPLDELYEGGLNSSVTEDTEYFSDDIANNASNSASSDGPRIVADSRLNAVIIRDSADRMPAYQELIKSMDRASEMVEIEATIVDVNTDKTRDFGVGWDFLRGDGTASVSGGAGSSSGLVKPDSQVSGPGAILSLALGGREQFLARVSALEEKGAARVVSKPHVVALSDVEAVLGTTTEYYVRVGDDDDAEVLTVPVGTTLRVTPHVFQESGQSRVKLLVSIEDAATTAQQTGQTPVVERANINTQAVINEGDSLLIGGLVRDSYKQLSSEVPLLGSIPVLGRLFKSTSNESSRVQRLFMITPRTASGLGFGRAHNGRRTLPVLQGQPADIEAYASDRMSDQAQPFGKRIDDIPFAPVRLPEPTAPSMLPAPVPAQQVRAVPQQAEPSPQPSFQKWAAVPGSEPQTQNVTPAVNEPNVDDRWSTVPTKQVATHALPERETPVDSNGWTIVE